MWLLPKKNHLCKVYIWKKKKRKNKKRLPILSSRRVSFIVYRCTTRFWRLYFGSFPACILTHCVYFCAWIRQKGRRANRINFVFKITKLLYIYVLCNICTSVSEIIPIMRLEEHKTVYYSVHKIRGRGDLGMKKNCRRPLRV